MLFGLLASAVVLVWVLSSWVLARAFDEVARAVVLDDLGEYKALYERSGPGAVRGLFAAGRHETDQMLRIVGPGGEVLLEQLLPGRPEVGWPEQLDPVSAREGETTWVGRQLPGGLALTLGGRKLADGGELWFGRTNASDREAIARVHRLLAGSLGVTAVLAIGPIFWFASRVLRPVRDLISRARRLACAGSTLQRLDGSGAIVELQELAAAFNQGLDQVQLLTEELEAANDQLAHGLRTPLARIRGNVERILSAPDSSAVHESAARAIGEIDRASRFIHAVLAVRAGDARTIRLQHERVALGGLVTATGELYSAAAEEKSLDLRYDRSGAGPAVFGDRERLQQALCSLLDNAFAYTSPGGRVEVEVQTRDPWATVSIRDTGPGLSEGDHDRIWRRFMRGSAASAATPGIGLGLSLVKSIVAAHEGEVGARNRPGGGAEFWFRLRLAGGDAAAGVGSGVESPGSPRLGSGPPEV